MSGKMSKNKGKRGERELANKLSKLWSIPFSRGQQYKGSPDSPDVTTSDFELSRAIHIECKRVEQLSLYKALEQASKDAGDRVPIVMHRRNGKDWVAVVELDRLLDLVVALKDIAEDQVPW